MSCRLRPDSRAYRNEVTQARIAADTDGEKRAGRNAPH